MAKIPIRGRNAVRIFPKTEFITIKIPSTQTVIGSFIILIFLLNIIIHIRENKLKKEGSKEYIRHSAGSFVSERGAQQHSLYLFGEASRFIDEIELFIKKVDEISQKLKVAPEWLMAIMYSESRFQYKVKNYRGSGAIGLIQFMPATAEELGTSTEQLQQMSPVEQLDYVYLYLNQVQHRYGRFQSITDVYLAVLFPKALNQNDCYALYYQPSTKYQMNKGLDLNKDGVVTKGDIDHYLSKNYPIAYISTI